MAQSQDWSDAGDLIRAAGTKGVPGPGGGRAAILQMPPEFLATTVQACGMYPWAIGGSTPMIGVPMGTNLLNSSTVCFDPIAWFTARPRLCDNPSIFVLGLPHKGKSTMVAHMLIGMAARGIRPLILGDLKPDYVQVVRKLGGQVIRLGRGQGRWNPLTPGNIFAAADHIQAAGAATGSDAAARALSVASGMRQEALGRQLVALEGLIHIARGDGLNEAERNALTAALMVLNDKHRAGHPPVIADLIALLESSPAQIAEAVLARQGSTSYYAAVDPLIMSLKGLTRGPMGEVFAHETTVAMDLDAPAIVVDISGIGEADSKLLAAVLLLTWSEGFSTVEARQAMADAGLVEPTHYFLVLDELWKVMRTSAGMVDRIDAVTRLNRTWGIGQAMISHSARDLDALDVVDRVKAQGYIERAGALLIGALPPKEFVREDGTPGGLADIVPFTEREKEMVARWATPAGLGGDGGAIGNFLLKIGHAPGVPFHVQLTSHEGLSVLNTNTRWEASR